RVAGRARPRHPVGQRHPPVAVRVAQLPGRPRAPLPAPHVRARLPAPGRRGPGPHGHHAVRWGPRGYGTEPHGGLGNRGRLLTTVRLQPGYWLTVNDTFTFTRYWVILSFSTIAWKSLT